MRFHRRLGPSQETGFAFFFEPVTVALDVDRRGVVQESVQNRRGQDVIIEDLAPVEKTLVGGDDHAGFFVPTHHQAEE